MNLNATLLGQMITFAVFVFVTMKYVWPPIVKALEERQKRIADGLAAADEAQRSLKAAQVEAAVQIQASKVKASEMIDQANHRAAQIMETAKEESDKETRRRRDSAEAEAKQTMNNAKLALQSQLAQLSVACAEKILKSTIDLETHQHLIDDVIGTL